MTRAHSEGIYFDVNDSLRTPFPCLRHQKLIQKDKFSARIWLKCCSDLDFRTEEVKHSTVREPWRHKTHHQMIATFSHEGSLVEFHHSLSVSDRHIVSLLICKHLSFVYALNWTDLVGDLTVCITEHDSLDTPRWLAQRTSKREIKMTRIYCIAWNVLQNLYFALAIFAILPSTLIEINISQGILIPLSRQCFHWYIAKKENFPLQKVRTGYKNFHIKACS